MREIKFRVWDLDKQVMGYFDILDLWNLGGRPLQIGPLEVRKDMDDMILMQYTGLKDKNGKEIYEGDIVKDKTWGNGEVKFGDFLVDGGDYYSNFCNAGWYVQFKGGDTETKDLDTTHEVIGNIYENPDLLTP